MDRNLEKIKSEYTELAFKAGDVQYRIYALQDDLAKLNKKLLELNLEAAELQKKEKKE